MSILTRSCSFISLEFNYRSSPSYNTKARHERHECNIFSHPYISYKVNEKLQWEKQFHSKNYLAEMPRSNAKMRLKTLPQKLNFIMAKALSKRVIEIVAANALARSRIVTPCNTTSFLIKTPLCETNNILLHKNYWKLGKMNATF